MKKATKKGKSKRVVEVQQADGDVLTYVQEELYLIEIKDLKAKLKRAQDLAEATQKLSEEYKEKYEEEVKTKEDISSYMKHCIEELAAEVGQLNEKIAELQAQHEAEKNKFEEKLLKSEEQYKQLLKNLNEENLTLSGKLASLEEFERQKDSLNKKLEVLEMKYNDDIQQYEEKLSLLQQEAIMEYDRLKKEHEEKQEETKQFQISDERAAYFITTAISEMKKLENQLQESRKQVYRLSEESDKLKSSKTLLNEKLIALEFTESGLTSKITKQKKVIERLQKQCEIQSKLLDEMKKFKDSYDKLQMAIRDYEAQVVEKENIITSLSDSNEKLNKQVEILKEKSRKQISINIELIIKILRAAKAIKEAIMPTSNGTAYERELLLNHMMMILDTASEFYTDYYFELLADHGIPSQQIESWFEEKCIAVKYQPGDLGFIPKNEKKFSIKQKEFKLDEVFDQQLKQPLLESRERIILSKVGLLTSFEELSQRLQQMNSFPTINQ